MAYNLPSGTGSGSPPAVFGISNTEDCTAVIERNTLALNTPSCAANQGIMSGTNRSTAWT